MDRSKKGHRGTLRNISVGVYEDHFALFTRLERTTGKRKGQIVRDALDHYAWDQLGLQLNRPPNPSGDE